MTVLVIGAGGMLGRPVAERLIADGVPVRVMGRDGAALAAKFGGRAEIVAGDVRDPGRIAAAVAGARAVHISIKAASPAEFQTLEAAGVRSIAAAAAVAGVGRLTYLSGAGIEAGDPRLLPVAGKQAAEAAIRASGVPFTILRATHFMESLDLFVRGDSASIIGRQPHAYHYLAAADYAAMVARALREPAAAGRALALFGPEAMTMRAALDRYAALLHPGMKVGTAPLPVIRLVAAVTRNRALGHAAVLFDAFRQLPETGDGAEADTLLGKAGTTLAAWCAARQAAAP